jgi:hypothetical protein
MWMTNTLLALLALALLWSLSVVAVGVWSFRIWKRQHVPADYAIAAALIGSGGVLFGLCVWKLSVVVTML